MLITGKITDSAGISLPYANVFFSDKQGAYLPGSAGTMADTEGNYELQGEGDYITASYTGYGHLTKAAKPGTVNFQLSEDGITLPEVQISGMPEWKKFVFFASASILLYILYEMLFT